jgi:hypothetical protein
MAIDKYRRDRLDKYKVGVVGLGDYGRAAEVIDYAYDRNISIGQAIIELVNSGLSHRR